MLTNKVYAFLNMSTSLEQLVLFKAQNPRASQEFLERASPLLKNIDLTKASDESVYSSCLLTSWLF